MRTAAGAAVLHHPWLALALIALLASLSWLLFRAIPSEFAPREDRGSFFMFITAPEGSSYEYTQRQVDEIEQRIMPLVEQGRIERMFNESITSRLLQGAVDTLTAHGVADDHIDVLLFCPGTDKAPAQRLATALRSQGYSVARDIIARDRQASLDYARRMHFRYLLIMNATNDGLTLQQTADGRETPLSLNADLAGECRL